MNHLLLGSLLVITLNAEKCNQDKSDGRAAEQDRTEQPAAGTDAPAVETRVGDEGMGEIEGRRWFIITLNEAEIGLPEGAERPYLELNNEQLNGFGGCNNLMGSYTLEEDRIHFTEVGSTKKYCPELQAIELSVLEMLGEVNNYGTEGDTLRLLQGTREVALLRTAEE
jgi:heat shock protein HslJ